MIGLTQLKSSNITAAGHDAATGTLKVQFTNGNVYEYRDVPVDVAAGLLQAESAGRYFAANIRGQYQHDAVVEEAPAGVK